MSNLSQCIVCQGQYNAECTLWTTKRVSTGFECSVCGRYEISDTAVSLLTNSKEYLSRIQRAALSHQLRNANREKRTPFIESTWLDGFRQVARLPTPAIQAVNAIRYIGDEVLRTGEKLPSLQPQIYALIGAPNPEFAGNLINELSLRGLINAKPDDIISEYQDFYDVSLTLSGWESYEKERTGRTSGKYGFLALQFGDTELEIFVRDVLKPCVKEGIGYELVDMRDVARAGIIDNIMRERIRDAAFVIVDLTHDNSGAYWEAGYAEGLGKPVIYVCEKNKFDSRATHFDTNHCTTVPWAIDDLEGFKSLLVATLRRSLDLFF